MSHDSDDKEKPEPVANKTVEHSWEEPFEPSVTIVEAVAAATGRRPADLPTLQKSVDPDALNRLLTQGEATGVSISFRYAGTVVVVEGDGAIEVQVDGTE